MPERIQLRRTKGWRKPEGAIVVARPTKWGNPWQIVPVPDHHFPWGDAADVQLADGTTTGRFYRWTDSPGTGAPYWAAQAYRRDLSPELRRAAQRELRGHDLACWCRLDQPCHADVLLEVANAPQDAA